METVLILLILAAVFVAIKGCIIVEQQEVVIVQRLGKYKETLGAGLNFIVPFIDSPKGIYRKVSTTYPDGRTYSYMQKSSRLDLRETVYDFPRQNVITKDNVSISINAVLYFQIINQMCIRDSSSTDVTPSHFRYPQTLLLASPENVPRLAS